mgnify:CR=1 FL=1
MIYFKKLEKLVNMIRKFKFIIILFSLIIYFELLQRFKWDFFVLPVLHLGVTLVMYLGIIFIADFQKFEHVHLVLMYALYIVFFSIGTSFFSAKIFNNLKQSYTNSIIQDLPLHTRWVVNTFLLLSILKFLFLFELSYINLL